MGNHACSVCFVVRKSFYNICAKTYGQILCILKGQWLKQLQVVPTVSPFAFLKYYYIVIKKRARFSRTFCHIFLCHQSLHPETVLKPVSKQSCTVDFQFHMFIRFTTTSLSLVKKQSLPGFYQISRNPSALMKPIDFDTISAEVISLHVKVEVFNICNSLF